VDCIIANSKTTRNNLVNKHRINPEIIKIHYPSINIAEFLSKRNNSFNIYKEHKISQNSFIIGTSGSATNRKGCETFIILAKIIDNLFPTDNIHFIWVGENHLIHEIDHDIEFSELQNKVTFVGNIANPIPYFQWFDVFISLSKEESFGMAAVEVALLEKPIVFFDKTGGLSEIFSDKTGGEIPYLNLIAMANKLIELYKNKKLRSTLGKEAKNIAKKFDENILMPELLSTLIECSTNYKKGT
jgi:glycosyltransferase involved in cell wall biosynthesis